MDGLDRIEKYVVLRAPRSRVWRALIDSREFGSWFGIALHGSFAAGEVITGTFLKGLNEEAIKDRQRSLSVPVSEVRQPESGFIFCKVERIEPERYFSFRWVPYGIDAESDPENEAMTLVEFDLADTPEGTLLTIIESGFARIPEHRRLRAFRMNEGGWSAQSENIRKYVEEI